MNKFEDFIKERFPVSLPKSRAEDICFCLGVITYLTKHPEKLAAINDETRLEELFPENPLDIKIYNTRVRYCDFLEDVRDCAYTIKELENPNSDINEFETFIFYGLVEFVSFAREKKPDELDSFIADWQEEVSQCKKNSELKWYQHIIPQRRNKSNKILTWEEYIKREFSLE